MHVVKSFICFFTALFFFQSADVPKKSREDYKQLFNHAEKLSNSTNPSDEKDQEALKTYLVVVHILSSNQADDHFLFKAYISTGTFLQVLGRQKESTLYLKDAIRLKERLPDLKDSVLFKPLVYCGNAYYQLDATDSAAIFYNKAENIAEKYPKVSELERLYNTLGVIAYSSGNYNKSVTYYEKAISTLLGHSSYDKSFLVVYRNNLASAFKKLKKYDQALAIYQGLLAYHIETDKLLHNIGAAYLAMGKNPEAIKYLNKVKYTDQKKLNDLGRAYFGERDYTNALNYLQKAVDLNKQVNHGYKNTDYSITLKYLGDLWFEKGQTLTGLTYYQKAINNLIFDFRSVNIYDNPAKFTSVFNAMELLEALKAKAIAFQKLYSQGRKIKDLQASLQTYLSFYKLANYVERIYENDDSRLLISDKKYASHQQPIDICLQLFKLTGNHQYIEQAFTLDEENKANTLSIYLQESKLKARSSIPSSLLQLEAAFKKSITRLSLAVSGEKDSIKIGKLNSQLNEAAINLFKVQKKINSETNFGRLKFLDENISVTSLQKIIPSKSAILSYHIGDTSIVCFVITGSKFDFFSTNIPANFNPSLKQLYSQAQLTEGADRKKIKALEQFFYGLLIKPAEQYIAGKTNLMMIPDDELNYLPFEIMTDGKGNNLLSQFSITYNYSCTILQNSTANTSNLLNSLGTAPFAESTAGPAKTSNEFSPLPASKAEIQTLNGTTLFNNQATKQQFLKSAHNFNIIHLATHAYANDRDPNQSFIAFYPTKPDSAINFKLYLPEIYDIKLDKTRLVVLSACESGVGELIKGEGLISLSRAFSYSGCDNIITSMWKADDVSTAYISERLHFYLQKGATIAYALQQAKLDYLNDDQIATAQKLPGYWAHFRLIGNFENQPGKPYWPIYLGALLLLGMLIIINRGAIKKLIMPRLKN